jgi:hypothetical protein
MLRIVSACGVLCSRCQAYLGQQKGSAHQKRTAASWNRIYGMKESAENISCAGCLSADDAVFHSSRRCKARRCCLSKGLKSCAECPDQNCPDLERAQSVWDGVPAIAKRLSPEDYILYAEPYCDHRNRLAEARRDFAARSVRT